MLLYYLRIRSRLFRFACLVCLTSLNLYENLIEVVFISIDLPSKILVLIFSVHEAVIDGSKGSMPTARLIRPSYLCRKCNLLPSYGS